MVFEEKKLQDLQEKIEILRIEMIKIGLSEGLNSEKTICISQKLDHYITKYQTQKTGLNHEPSFF